MSLATIGVFSLWFGWFGFNGGSVLTRTQLGWLRCTTTSIAAALGGIVAATCSWIFGSKPDLSMALNGIWLVWYHRCSRHLPLDLHCWHCLRCCGIFLGAVLRQDRRSSWRFVSPLTCGIIGTLFAATVLTVALRLVKGIFLWYHFLRFRPDSLHHQGCSWLPRQRRRNRRPYVGEHGVTAYHRLEAN